MASTGAVSFIHPSNGSAQAHTTPGFLDSPRGQLYYVMHHATTQHRGSILLCGPLNAERERSYPTLVRWARLLAAQGYDTMRFDYRGIGESSGWFESMTMTDWCVDAAFCAEQLGEISRGVPLILHGARGGALIAAELFASGIGDALLLWAPPPSGYALLWDALRRNLAANMVANPGAPSRTREQLIAALEAGELINVDGYFWSKNFWTDAQRHTLLLPHETEQRQWHIVNVKTPPKSAINNSAQGHDEFVCDAPFWESSTLFSPDNADLFRLSLKWLDALVPKCGDSV